MSTWSGICLMQTCHSLLQPGYTVVIGVQSISAQHISYRRAAFRKTRYYSQETQWSLMYSPYLPNTSVIGGRHTHWSLMYSPYLPNTSVIGGRHTQWSLMYSPYLTNTSVIGGRHSQWSLMYSPYLTNTSVIGGRHSGKLAITARRHSGHWCTVHICPTHQL